MEKINRPSSVALKIVSLILAIILWAYVAYQENPEMTHWVKNVPITVVGTDELDASGYSVVETSRTTVDVKLRGERLSLAKLKTDDISAVLDISKIGRQGEVSLACDISVNKKNIDVADSRHSTVNVRVEEIISSDFSVSTNFVGSPAKGYSVFDPTVSCTAVTVRGAESIVNSISAVTTKSISVSGVSRSNSVSVGFTAFDSEGKAVSGVTFEPASVEVGYTVLKEKTVPLKVVMVNIPYDKEITYTPETIKIYGNAEAVSAVTELRSERTNVSAVEDGSELPVKLMMPSGVRLTGDTATADVTFEVTDVEIEN